MFMIMMIMMMMMNCEMKKFRLFSTVYSKGTRNGQKQGQST